MVFINYNREKAVAYATEWALKRNSRYYNFDSIGGDCTNFVSQCLFSGIGVMNYSNINGWYYSSSSQRAPAWTSVEYFYSFLITNQGVGPFASLILPTAIEIGDIIQLGNGNFDFYHTLIVTNIVNERIFVSAHTFDAFNRPLESYSYNTIRFLHIEGGKNY